MGTSRNVLRRQDDRTGAGTEVLHVVLALFPTCAASQGYGETEDTGSRRARLPA